MWRIALILLLSVCFAGCTVPPKPAKADDVKVVVFTARWCGPCQREKRLWVAPPGVQLEVVDIDEQPAKAKAYRVDRVPTYVVEVNGEERARGFTWAVVVWALRKIAGLLF